MALNTKAFALAASFTAAAAFTVRAVFVAVAPGFATTFTDVTHLDLTNLGRVLTWATYFEGLFFWSIWTGLVFGFVGRLYNGLSRNTAETRASVRPAAQQHA